MSETGERKALAEFGGEQGWNRRVSDDQADVYTKDTVRIRVIWRGDEAVSGASLFHDGMYEAYTRDLASVRAWLRR
jgi:hypothetical protein